ncbi:MAG: GNAT family N-acetyltransferase [Planctomycetes bacterium]|nr:GNAT family N-acetyltransferase [Planctomycetota bacterium]
MSRGLIRRAGPDDAETIFAFVVALATYEREPDAVATTAAILREQLTAEPAPFECLLIEEDGRAQGFALYFHNYSTWRGRPGLYLEDLFVLPEARGRGHGLALLEELGRIAVDRGCGRMEWACLEWNQPAKDFYAALGARPLHDWRVWRLDGDALARLGRRTT